MPSKRKASDERASAGSAGEPPSIDAVLTELEVVVRDLESGALPLERALERFERGVALARTGTELLDALERRVEVLLDPDGARARLAGPAADSPVEPDDEAEG